MFSRYLGDYGAASLVASNPGGSIGQRVARQGARESSPDAPSPFFVVVVIVVVVVVVVYRWGCVVTERSDR